MKKIILLFVAAIGISTSFVSCSKDDDASLEGKWEISQEGGIINDTEILTDYVNECSTKKDYFEFFSNGTLAQHFFYSDCEEDVYTTTYTRSGKTITIGAGEFSSTATIMKLSGSTLKVKYEDESFPDSFGVSVFKRVSE